MYQNWNSLLGGGTRAQERRVQVAAHVVEEAVVEVYVSRLRKRLEPFGIRIKTARGLGYMLDVPNT